MDTVINNFSEGLRVRSLTGSDVIRVEYTSLFASKAALIANTIVDLYMVKRLRDNSQSFEKMTAWLRRRMEELRVQVSRAEQNAENYRAQYNLTRGIAAPVSAEQAQRIARDLRSAQQDLFEAQQRLEQMLSVSSHAGNLKSIAQLVDLSAVEDLRHDEARIEAEIAQLSARYGAKHPLMMKKHAELKKIRSVRDIEREGLIGNFEDEVDLMQVKVDDLQIQYDNATMRFNDDSEAMIHLRDLEGEVEAAKSTLSSFKKAYQRAEAQKDLQDPQARVISYAVIPHMPSFPNKRLLLVLSLGLSAFIGFFVILILEKAQSTFRTGNELEEACNLPCFSLIPKAKYEKGVERSNYVLSHPSSIVAEAVRTLRVVLNLHARSAGNEKKPKVVAVTSSFPDEGKTTLSIWLARLAAQSGEKVIIVDTDLRKPNIHKSIDVHNEVSLVEFLTNQKQLKEIIHKDQGSGADVIFGRSVPNSAINLLSSQHMADLIETLKEQYDLVILDMPACLPVSDSRVLSVMADQVLYVVHWNKTSKRDVFNGVKQFKDMNFSGKIAFVLQHVDVKRHRQYGHNEVSYYYKDH
jgi:capsular exopolysaccharide synthesis family protein